MSVRLASMTESPRGLRVTKLAFGLVGPLALSIAATTVACQGDSTKVVETRADPSDSRADDAFNRARASGRMDEPPDLPDLADPSNGSAADGGASMASARTDAASATPPTPSTKPDAAAGAAMPPPSAAADSAAPADPAHPPDRAEPPPSEAFTWPADCDYKQKFVAHGATGTSDTTKYRVGPETQELATFIFAPPWGSDRVQLLAARPLFDNNKIVHHWSL